MSTAVRVEVLARNALGAIFGTLLRGIVIQPRLYKRPLTPSSCLHGLRGLGACAVFLRHLLVSFWGFPDLGSTREEADPVKQAFRRFPFLRLPFSGNAMVVVFFVVSGYVDSIKPLQLVHGKQWAPLQGHLASSVLRRGPRLFLPALGAAVLISMAVWLGLYEWGLEYRLSLWGFKENLPLQLKRHDSIPEQLAAMWSSFSELFNIWKFDYILPAVNMHYWTLPFDLRTTFIRHLTILCSSRLSPGGRLLVLAAVICFCGSWARWEVALNLCGVLLCQIDLLTGWFQRASHQMASTGRKVGNRRTRWTCAMLLVLSLYLCLFPKENGRYTPGFRFLSWLAPISWQDYRYWNSWAAIMLVWAVLHHDRFSRFLEGPIPQYLGNISFAMYLTHGPILHMTAYTLVPMVQSLGIFGELGGFLVPTIFVVIPSVVLVADLFARTVEFYSYSLIRRSERFLVELS